MNAAITSPHNGSSPVRPASATGIRMTARARSAAIMIVRRFHRSAARPPWKPKTSAGRLSASRTAMTLDALARYALEQLRRPPLCHAHFCHQLVAAYVRSEQTIDECASDFDLGHHLRQLELSILKRCDRLAEGAALLGICDRVFET